MQAPGYIVTTLYSYSPRDIAGTDTLSEHAFGNAIDINPGANPVSYNGVVTDLPPNIRDIAAKNDLVWGGDFGGSKKDAMHFEYNPSAVAQGYDANGNLSGVVVPGLMAHFRLRTQGKVRSVMHNLRRLSRLTSQFITPDNLTALAKDAVMSSISANTVANAGQADNSRSHRVDLSSCNVFDQLYKPLLHPAVQPYPETTPEREGSGAVKCTAGKIYWRGENRESVLGAPSLSMQAVSFRRRG